MFLVFPRITPDSLSCGTLEETGQREGREGVNWQGGEALKGTFQQFIRHTLTHT